MNGATSDGAATAATAATAGKAATAAIPKPPRPREILTLVAGLPARELEVELAAACRRADVGHRAQAFYLWDMQRRGAHQELGFPSAVAFAVARLDLSRRKARSLLACGRALDELRVVDEAFRHGRLSWSKVRAVGRVAVPETETQWVEFAERASQQEVERRVHRSRPGDAPGAAAGEDATGLPGARFALCVDLDALEHEAWECARAKLRDELDQPVTDRELLAHLVHLWLSTDADGTVPGRRPVDGSLYRVIVRVDGAGARNGSAAGDGTGAGGGAITGEVSTDDGPMPLGPAEVERALSDGATPPKLRSAVLERDGCRCRACGSRYRLMAHHVEFRSRGGKTVESNLTGLCAACHGLVHDGLLRVECDGNGGFAFRDRDGRSLFGRTRHGGLVVECRADVPSGSPAGGSAESGKEATAGSGENGSRGQHEKREKQLRLEDIPPVVDSEWWREHEHLFQWTRNGREARLRDRVREESPPYGWPHGATSVSIGAEDLGTLEHGEHAEHGEGRWPHGATRVSDPAVLAGGRVAEDDLLEGEPGRGRWTRNGWAVRLSDRVREESPSYGWPHGATSVSVGGQGPGTLEHREHREHDYGRWPHGATWLSDAAAGRRLGPRWSRPASGPARKPARSGPVPRRQSRCARSLSPISTPPAGKYSDQRRSTFFAVSLSHTSSFG